MSYTERLKESRIQQSIRIAMDHKFACKCYHCLFWLSYKCPRCSHEQPRCWCHKGDGSNMR